MRVAMEVASSRSAISTAGLDSQQHCHRHRHVRRWISPFRTSFHASALSKHCHPSTLRFQSLRYQYLSARADSQGERGTGDNESKEVLEAFFLGKALAEAVTERLGTLVGELLSDVGRWQAEQQRQVRDFQDEVQERAKKARLKAFQEARSSQQVESPSLNGASVGTAKAQGTPVKKPTDPAQGSVTS
ncbi:hypothetical protein KP509_14G026600 [Ceratopteris richardii]|uniref:Uncharacterized protein n=1 Tax=Ceratopteris richardii TaxID=49495 RepID=A0A8T2TAD3_CERRI|nr:hypothetical protein KP509_14G026600 [Ceratopteris richardii]